jgi:hypothetical protein
MLRIFFKYNRRLLGELCRCALRSLTLYFEVVTGSELMPGVIAAIQTFGTKINFHPHLHFLVTEGGVERLSLDEKEGRVCYRYGKEAEDVERMDYLEFVARVTSHIPDKGQVTVRYYGLYANAQNFIAFLTDFAVVDKIIDHLKLSFIAERPPPSHIAYQEVLMAAEASTEYSP